MSRVSSHLSRRAIVGSALLAAAFALAPVGARATTAGDSVFQLVGHSDLYMRGMNAAPALYSHYLYVGNRTDAQPQHLHPGVLIVDVADPANPQIVGEIGQPNEANVGETSRELRVWPQQKLLIVMNFSCSAIIHACLSQADAGKYTFNFKFYDLSNPAAPTLVATYVPSALPHEMFLWVDPRHRASRALLYFTTPNGPGSSLVVTDISHARQGTFTDLARWAGNGLFPGTLRSTQDVRLHSLSLTPDGTRAYLAYLGGGFLVLDTRDFAVAKPSPVIRVLNTPGDPSWGSPGTHSAIKIPHSQFALTTDEVYGDLLTTITGYKHGCPWGWARTINISDQAHPKVIGQVKMPQNDQSYCGNADPGPSILSCDIAPAGDPLNTTFTSYSSHNPTVLPHLALVTWHSDGLVAVDLTNAAKPKVAGTFSPTPLAAVVTEDPALSLGESKVVMWSYPIIRNGLIYVVDIRNGLYILRYTGPRAADVAKVKFLEGNSNLGDAARLESG